MEKDDMLLIMHCMAKVDPRIYFHLSKCNPNAASSSTLMTLYGLSYSVLAVQLRAANMAGCVTGPLEKVLPGVLCAK